MKLLREIEAENKYLARRLATFPYNYHFDVPLSSRKPLSAADQQLIDASTWHYDNAAEERFTDAWYRFGDYFAELRER